MRTYAGHSSPVESNALYRRNLATGQTGLSVAFDLPTQTGYDPDDELAVGEVGKVGVPVTHLGACGRLGVARVFTPKDFAITDIMAEGVAVIREANDLGGPVPA